MNHRMHTCTVTLLSALLASSGAAAQSHHHCAPANATRNGDSHSTGVLPPSGIGCPSGFSLQCVSPEAQAALARAIPSPAAMRRARMRAEARRAAQQQAEADRLEHERMDRAREDSQRQALANANDQLDSERRERERLAAERDRLAAERDRLAAEQAMARTAPTPVTRPASMFRPRLTAAVEAGGGGWSRDMANAVHPGATWGARVGVQLTDWLIIDGRYFGMYNFGRDAVVGPVANSVTNGATANVRLMAPFQWVRPYAFAGIGAYSVGVTGTDVNTQNTPLRQATRGVVPLGVGVEVPIVQHVSIGAEGQYHVTFGNNTYGVVPQLATGDIWSVNGVLRFTM